MIFDACTERLSFLFYMVLVECAFHLVAAFLLFIGLCLRFLPETKRKIKNTPIEKNAIVSHHYSNDVNSIDVVSFSIVSFHFNFSHSLSLSRIFVALLHTCN